MGTATTTRPGRTVTGSRRTIETYVAEELAYASEAEEHITINAAGDTYFVVWHMDGRFTGTVQVDTFTVTDEA